jgi:hypothetical protein
VGELATQHTVFGPQGIAPLGGVHSGAWHVFKGSVARRLPTAVIHRVLREGGSVVRLAFTWMPFACALLVGGCDAAHRLLGRTVVYPHAGPIVLPLRDPLLGPDPSVEASLPAVAAPTPGSFWMTVSSLHPVSLLHEGKPFDPTDPYRHARKNEISFVPTLVLGGAPLRDVLVTAGNFNAVGQSILSDRPWEIDWDRGTLTLDAPPWSPASPARAVHVPLRRRDGRDIVEMRAAGHSFDMALATDSSLSTIPDAVGTLFRGNVETGPDHRTLEDYAFIGAMPVGWHYFFAEVEGRVPYGILGLDILACHRMRVDPGRELSLAPRQESAPIAAERVARWPALRGCADAGCVCAHVERPSLPITVALDVEKPYPFSALIVLRCHGDETLVVARACDARPWRSRHGMPLDYKPGQLLVPVPQGASGRILSTVNAPERFSSFEWPCTELSVADVVQLVPGSGAGGSASQREDWDLPGLLWVFETARSWEGTLPRVYGSIWGKKEVEKGDRWE